MANIGTTINKKNTGEKIWWLFVAVLLVVMIAYVVHELKEYQNVAEYEKEPTITLASMTQVFDDIYEHLPKEEADYVHDMYDGYGPGVTFMKVCYNRNYELIAHIFVPAFGKVEVLYDYDFGKWKFKDILYVDANGVTMVESETGELRAD